MKGRHSLGHDWEQGEYIEGGTLEGRVDWDALEEMEQHAMELIERWREDLDDLVLAWSGGMDSVVILHLCYRLEAFDVTPVSFFTPEFFWSVVEYAGKLPLRWGFDPEIVWTWEQDIEWVEDDPERNLFPDYQTKQRMLENSFRGDLTEYNQTHDVDMYLSGHRNEHNRTVDYVNPRWGAYQGSPLRTWSHNHVIAYCDKYSIPISPLYHTYSTSGGRPWNRKSRETHDGDMQSVGELFYYTRDAAVRHGYAGFWERIVDHFPEAEREAVAYAADADEPCPDVEAGYEMGCDVRQNPAPVGPET